MALPNPIGDPGVVDGTKRKVATMAKNKVFN